jgi:hypothetical protein
MKTINVMLVLCLLLVGIAIGFYLARNVLPPAKVTMMRFNPVGDMIVGAKAGDHLQWYNGTDPAPVQFKFGLNPCTNPGDPAHGTCTMKDSAVYPFNCAASGCKDPGVGGGDETLQGTQFGPQSSHLDPPYADPGPSTVNVFCDQATSTAKASAVVQGKQGTGFTIQVAGATDFTAMFPAGTCDPGDSLNGASPNCRIKPAVAADTNYSYGITVTGCTNPGTATLTELKP